MSMNRRERFPGMNSRSDGCLGFRPHAWNLVIGCKWNLSRLRIPALGFSSIRRHLLRPSDWLSAVATYPCRSVGLLRRGLCCAQLFDSGWFDSTPPNLRRSSTFGAARRRIGLRRRPARLVRTYLARVAAIPLRGRSRIGRLLLRRSDVHFDDGRRAQRLLRVFVLRRR